MLPYIGFLTHHGICPCFSRLCPWLRHVRIFAEQAAIVGTGCNVKVFLDGHHGKSRRTDHTFLLGEYVAPQTCEKKPWSVCNVPTRLCAFRTSQHLSVSLYNEDVAHGKIIDRHTCPHMLA